MQLATVFTGGFLAKTRLGEGRLKLARTPRTKNA
ncbi:hypothetical protein VPHD184_0056 [Vibrio phage D184]